MSQKDNAAGSGLIVLVFLTVWIAAMFLWGWPALASGAVLLGLYLLFDREQL